jgi:hypothetical protein
MGVLCMGFFGPNYCIPANWHRWQGEFDHDGVQYVSGVPEEEKSNLVGPGTSRPAGTSLQQCMNWYWKARTWTLHTSLFGAESSSNNWSLTNNSPIDPITPRLKSTVNGSFRQTISYSGNFSVDSAPSREFMQDILCGAGIGLSMATGDGARSTQTGGNANNPTEDIASSVGATVQIDPLPVLVDDIYWPTIRVTSGGPSSLQTIGSTGPAGNTGLIPADAEGTELGNLTYAIVVNGPPGSARSVESGVTCTIDGLRVQLYIGPSLRGGSGTLAPLASPHPPTGEASFNYTPLTMSGEITMVVQSLFE